MKIKSFYILEKAQFMAFANNDNMSEDFNEILRLNGIIFVQYIYSYPLSQGLILLSETNYFTSYYINL